MAEKPFNVATHNGIITIKSSATRQHRTIKISTGKDGSTRWVSMLTGPDNEHDYKSFGRIGPTGSVVVFRKLKDEDATGFYDKLARILNFPEQYIDRLEFQFASRCRVCNRILTNPESLLSGIGPECRLKNDS